MKSIIILASGQGSNARAIFRYFERNSEVGIRAIVSDRESEGLEALSDEMKVPYIKINPKSDLALMQIAKEHKADLIVLAGYLRKIPASLIAAYPNAIVNLHPSLLPAYGGRGMYGSHVHKAVLVDGAKRSGITIHLIDEEYDRGTTLLQASCPVLASDDITTLSKRIQALEHRYFPVVIESLLL